jgi:hypothetical protein
MAANPDEKAPYAVHGVGRKRTARADFWHGCDPGAYRTGHLPYDPGKRFPVTFYIVSACRPSLSSSWRKQ